MAAAQVTAEATAVAEPAAAPAEVAAANQAPAELRRFDLFIVDVGWKSTVAESLRNNLNGYLRYQHSCNVYILSPEQCIQFFRRHPSAIGTEPSIIIIDRDAYAARRPQGFGFKLNLGMIRDVPTAHNLVKWVMAVLAEQKPGSDITEPIRTVIHKEGIRGAIDILADMAKSPVGEAITH
jgi:hypothetical protein